MLASRRKASPFSRKGALTTNSAKACAEASSGISDQRARISTSCHGKQQITRSRRSSIPSRCAPPRPFPAARIWPFPSQINGLPKLRTGIVARFLKTSIVPLDSARRGVRSGMFALAGQQNLLVGARLDPRSLQGASKRGCGNRYVDTSDVIQIAFAIRVLMALWPPHARLQVLRSPKVRYLDANKMAPRT
jgi:hypothetical protein